MRSNPILWRALFFLVLLSPVMARAQDLSVTIPESHLAIGTEVNEKVPEKSWTVDLRGELRSQEDLRKRPQNRSNQSLHEISMGGSYRFDDQVRGELELSFESVEEQNQFLAKQAFLDWTPFGDRAHFIVGQQFVPLGLVLPRDNWFSSLPGFYQKILPSEKSVDLGLTAQWLPFSSNWIWFEAGTYAGRLIRAQDQSNPSPERAPRLVSLKTESGLHQAFATYFEHDLAFFDPTRALGVGFKFTPQWRSLGFEALIEYWQTEQIQRVGPDEQSNALILFGQAQWRFVNVGYRWSEAKGQIRNAQNSLTLPTEVSDLAFVNVRLASIFSAQLERVLEQQSEVQRDEWVGRVLLDWSN